jgi:subtilisin family serine protease
VCAVAAISVLAPGALAQSNQKFEAVLIETSKPYRKLVSDITNLGGKVTKQYQNIDAIAADIPVQAMGVLKTLVGSDSLSKDMPVSPPRGVAPGGRNAVALGKSLIRGIHTKSGDPISSIPSSDGDPYVLNFAGLNLQSLHKRGWTGKDVVVAVIDSGIRSESSYKVTDRFRLVGCKNLALDNGNCIDPNNDPHGTFIAGEIAGNVIFDLTGTQLLTSINQNLPTALMKNAHGQKTLLPLIGSAPGAGVYAFRVFGPGVGATNSILIDAIDQVIDLKKKGLNIKVCNISLGTTTLVAGRNLLDKAVNSLLDADIVPVLAAGDAGPSSLTIASPASSPSALSVGGSSPAANIRVFWDTCDARVSFDCFINFAGFLGAGLQNRPTGGTQTVASSSRGPNADGRTDPDVVASGDADFGWGYTDDPSAVDIGAGTSFSAPIVAGVAAVLRQAHPENTATQIRNAIVSSANPRLINDGSGILDRGAGLVDAQAAEKLLAGGGVSRYLPQFDRPSEDVETNIERGTNLRVLRGSVAERVRNLKPGQRDEILYEIRPNTDKVVVSVPMFSPSNSPNPFWGDDLILNVHSAKTSQIAAVNPNDPTTVLFGDYYVNCICFGGEQFTIQDPEPGVMRITIKGDAFAGGPVSADVTVLSTQEPLPNVNATGKISDNGTVAFTVDVPKDFQQANFQLSWPDNWASYPTDDFDFLSIVDPTGKPVAFSIEPVPRPDPTLPDPIPGLESPQTVSVTAQTGKKLAKGKWHVVAFINLKSMGVATLRDRDKVRLRVTVDGQALAHPSGQQNGNNNEQ